MFTIRYPKNTTELEACFAMVKNSLYYDGSLEQDKIVAAWDLMLCEGVGDVLIVENQDYTDWLNSYSERRDLRLPAFIACLSGCFITEKHAKRIVFSKPKYLGMDFLTRYIAFHQKEEGENPAATMKEIVRGHAIPPDLGLHFASYMPVLHPYIEGQLLDPTPEFIADLPLLGESYRDFSLRTFGGFNLHSFFNAPIGAFITGGYLANGQKLLCDFPDNDLVSDPEKRYILCVTRDAEISLRLDIPPGQCEVSGLSWFGIQLHSLPIRRGSVPLDPSRATLSPLEKKYGYLLVKGYTRDQIADWLYANKKNRNPDNSVTQLQRKVFEKLQEANYLKDTDPNIEMDIVNVLRKNLPEIRPAIVPLYPELKPNN
jgi:hypothetical protein